MTRVYIYTISAAICIWPCQAEKEKIEREARVEINKEVDKDLDPESFIKNLKKGMSHRQVRDLVERLKIKSSFFVQKNKKNSAKLFFMRDVKNSGDIVAIEMGFLNGKLDKWTLGYQR